SALEPAFLPFSPREFALSEPLSSDILLLDRLLGDVLRAQGGETLLRLARRIYEDDGECAGAPTPLPWPAESKVLVTYDLGYSEAVVEFGDIDVSGSDICHLVGFLRCGLRRLDGSQALPLVKTERVLGLSCSYDVDIIVRQFLCEFRLREYQAACAVGDKGTVVEF